MRFPIQQSDEKLYASKLIYMISNIRVAYDISLLGAGHVNYQSRTGIFRVVEEILSELNQRDECCVRPISLNKESTIWDDVSSFLYLQEVSPGLLTKFDETYHSAMKLRGLYLFLVNIQRNLTRSTNSRKSLRYKIARALHIFGSRIARLESSVSLFKGEVDVYHGSYFPLPDRKWLPGIPRVLTVYDLIPLLYPKLFISSVYKRTVDLFNSIDIERDWIICISEHTKKDFCLYTGMSQKRVFVVPLAAAAHFYPVCDEVAIQTVLRKYGVSATPYILSLCTLEPRKNLSTLVDAFSEFVRSHPTVDLNLVLVGANGWEDREIFRAVREDDLIQKRIFFTGYVPDYDLAPIYSGSLAFIYPSLYEGFGLPPLEAMQCGAPVVVSHSSSLPEVVGDAGILVDPKCKKELAHAIWKMVDDVYLRNNLSRRSLMRARQFGWSRSAD